MRSSEVIVHNACNNLPLITSSRKHKYDHSVNIHPHHLDLFNPWTGFLENIKNPAWKIAKKKKLMSTYL